MIDLSTLTPYEILDVDPRATVAEIKRALQIALKAYGADHMATYGLFTEAQREEILNRVHEAYNVLVDPERRRQFDEELHTKGRYPSQRAVETQEPEGAPAPAQRHRAPDVQQVEAPEVREERERLVRELLTSAEERGEWSGALLRQLREIRGLSLDDIAQRTKISRGHLKSIEEDSFDFLPPDVYVKGFILQLAKVIGLDAERITPRLMEHVRRKRGIR
jgi:flagellar biosynthesis protein FlhG